MISATGVAFPAEIAAALQSPQADSERVARFALIGLFYVGVVPVALGLPWYPSMHRLGRKGMSFVLALTVGLLAFPGTDRWEEAQEVGLAVAAQFAPQKLAVAL